MKTYQLGDKLTIRDKDDIVKDFTVVGINRKTYTILHTTGDRHAPNKKGFVSFCRYMNKETNRIK